jgi:hypothetical protein
MNEIWGMPGAEGNNAYGALARNPEGNIQFGWPRCGLELIIKMDAKEAV